MAGTRQRAADPCSWGGGGGSGRAQESPPTDPESPPESWGVWGLGGCRLENKEAHQGLAGDSGLRMGREYEVIFKQKIIVTNVSRDRSSW